jgi:DNA helicase II / ATP-dependent DNA helicase PcrA
MKEYRIFGPPGTGKTTRLATRDIPQAVEKFGGEGVVVTSFTVAAAKEIAARGIPVDPQNTGTLHSLCYHALGRPELTENHIKDWNAQYKGYALSGEGRGDEAWQGRRSRGDQLAQTTQLLREKRTPVELWRPEVMHYYNKWTEWKNDNNYMDFTDLIELALMKNINLHGTPKVMFVDEAQDFTPLQLALIREIAEDLDWVVLVGDDDQCIYSFAGASPDAFLDPPIPASLKTVLSQSYRVPRAVHKRAQSIISQVGRREEKEYAPRDFQGEVTDLKMTYKQPIPLIQAGQADIKAGRKVMYLASCSFMLKPIELELRQRGIPFHNPYRNNRGDWNPLGRRNGVSSSDILTSFLKRKDEFWTPLDLVTWGRFIKVGPAGLLRGKGKANIETLRKALKSDPKETSKMKVSIEALRQVLAPEAIEPAINRNVEWLKDNLLTKRRETIAFPLAVYRNGGLEALEKTPDIVLGTIHSVKGGEADSVYLAPDISYSGAVEMASPEGWDAAMRLFYVGMTRAKQELNLLKPVPSRGEALSYVEL